MMSAPLFSSRFGRNYNSAAGAVTGQFGNTVMPGQFVRHGSDERSSSSLRRNRSRDRPMSQPAPQVCSGPAGVQERQEWLDALSNVQERVSVLERNDRNLAGHITKLEAVATDHDAKFTVVGEDIAAYKHYLTGILFSNN